MSAVKNKLRILEKISISLDAFEGPLDLLLHLITKNKIDIYDIPVARLTEQYMSYIEGAGEESMERLSGFLVMAAELLEIKSKMLLPKPPKSDAAEEDPREALVNRIVEYKRYKEVLEQLMLMSEAAERFIMRPPQPVLDDVTVVFEPINISNMLGNVTINKLSSLFLDVLKRKDIKAYNAHPAINAVYKDNFTIEEKKARILNILSNRKCALFSELFPKDAYREEKIVTFLALLELVKLKKIDVRQNYAFDPIEIVLCY